MPTGYHDDSNNPRNNLVVHRAATDAGRGIPAVGKLVYRTNTAGFEACSATTPDPTLNGGGTWALVPTFRRESVVPRLYQSVALTDIAGASSLTKAVTMVGDNISWVWATIKITASGAGTAGQPIIIDPMFTASPPQPPYGGGEGLAGSFRLIPASGNELHGIVTGDGSFLYLRTSGTTSRVGVSSTTLATNDVLELNVTAWVTT